MREIKFRAWNKVRAFMIYDVDINSYGQVIKYDYGQYAGSYDFPIMQYTGLKDINGKDIYEGDIVKCFRTEGIEFVTTRLGAHGIETQIGFYPFVDIHGRVEVIGNIYENPELLEDVDN
mgnify:CR=1 FL=1